MNICIVDSGLNRRIINDLRTTCIDYAQGSFEIINNGDTLGHGTAVYSIIRRGCPEANIWVLKAFDHTQDTDETVLRHCIEYIDKHLKIDIVHISAGITYCENIPSLKKACTKLTRKGTVIVSAFDNEGGISYPAAFSDVVGVDIDESVFRQDDFIYIKNSVVNVRGIASEQRLPWLFDEYRYVAGSSFAAPHITVIIAEIIENGGRNINHELCKRAIRIVNQKQVKKEITEKPLISNALLFPFNKETHSVIRYENLLYFKLMYVCDTKYTGNVGKSTAKLLNTETGHTITNIDKVEWSKPFDTVIIGHVDKHMLMDTNLLQRLVKKCIQHNKQIYSFDVLDIFEFSDEKITVPLFQANAIPIYKSYPFGKLRCIAKPVIGVFGTSSRQGKFTVQLRLRESFLLQGYKVGQLGTEPSSLLFGFDQMITTGYNSRIPDSNLLIQHINYLMGQIEDTEPDIIICGGQSLTVPANYHNVYQFPIAQYCTLLACQPDIIVLCINIFDTEEYISRTITHLECVIETKVVALVLSPFISDLKWINRGTRMAVSDINEVTEVQKRLIKKFGIPVFNLLENIEKVFEVCICAFS